MALARQTINHLVNFIHVRTVQYTEYRIQYQDVLLTITLTLTLTILTLHTFNTFSTRTQLSLSLSLSRWFTRLFKQARGWSTPSVISHDLYIMIDCFNTLSMHGRTRGSVHRLFAVDTKIRRYPCCPRPKIAEPSIRIRSCFLPSYQVFAKSVSLCSLFMLLALCPSRAR